MASVRVLLKKCLVKSVINDFLGADNGLERYTGLADKSRPLHQLTGKSAEQLIFLLLGAPRIPEVKLLIEFIHRDRLTKHHGAAIGIEEGIKDRKSTRLNSSHTT